MPNEQKVTRKLRAVMSADVKGYSLLMADDEVHTIQTLKAYRILMSNLILQHSGRVVDNPGDNLLAEFSSAADAVGCAVEIQKKLKKENTKFVEDKKLQFRIGVNIGDVIHDGDRIYGNGVNIAARIEGLAQPGGIIKSYFDIKEDDREFIIKKKVQEKTISLDQKLTSSILPIYDLLTVRIDDDSYAKLDPAVKKEKCFEALRNFTIRLSQDKPLIIAIEDLHWIDKTSENFLEYLIDWVPNTSILLILLYRPEYVHQWGTR